MIHLASDMTPADAQHEACLESFAAKCRGLDGWLREARGDIKAGDVVSLKESMLAVNIEFGKLIENQTIT